MADCTRIPISIVLMIARVEIMLDAVLKIIKTISLVGFRFDLFLTPSIHMGYIFPAGVAHGCMRGNVLFLWIWDLAQQYYQLKDVFHTCFSSKIGQTKGLLPAAVEELIAVTARTVLSLFPASPATNTGAELCCTQVRETCALTNSSV